MVVRRGLAERPVAEISEKIERCYGTRPCAYIPKIYNPETVAWLLNVAVLRNGQVVGEIDKDEYETIQEMYRIATGKYVFTPDSRFFEKASENGSSSGRNRSSDIVHGGRQTLDYQIIGIVDSPQLLADGRVDLCDSCPDAILYKGELLPKCILDEIKNGLEVVIQR